LKIIFGNFLHFHYWFSEKSQRRREGRCLAFSNLLDAASPENRRYIQTRAVSSLTVTKISLPSHIWSQQTRFWWSPSQYSHSRTLTQNSLKKSTSLVVYSIRQIEWYATKAFLTIYASGAMLYLGFSEIHIMSNIAAPSSIFHRLLCIYSLQPMAICFLSFKRLTHRGECLSDGPNRNIPRVKLASICMPVWIHVLQQQSKREKTVNKNLQQHIPFKSAEVSSPIKQYT
jgi:hypothetical protein